MNTFIIGCIVTFCLIIASIVSSYVIIHVLLGIMAPEPMFGTAFIIMTVCVMGGGMFSDASL